MSDTFSTFLASANKEASKVTLAAAAKHASTVFPCWWMEKVRFSQHLCFYSQPGNAASIPQRQFGFLCLGCWTAPLLQQQRRRRNLPSPPSLPKSLCAFSRCLLFSGALFPEQLLGGIRSTAFCMKHFSG